ncbi:MAG TPA: nucleotidyltransferase family protein [Polyangiaceae bacterium]
MPPLPLPLPRNAEIERRRAWLDSHGEALDDVAAYGYHVLARTALRESLRRLDAAGIPALVVKGVVLAYLLYDTPIDRPLVDVDLRVRPADLPRALAALQAAPPHGERARPLVSSRVQQTAVVSLHRIQIDLESHIGPRFVCKTSVATMLQRAERTDQGLGFPHLRPELHDHAVLLAINLFKDRMTGGAWRTRDLERIVRLPGFDPETLGARAAEAGCLTIVYVVARYLADTQGDPILDAVARRIRPPRPRFAAHVLSTLRGEHRIPLLAWRVEVRAAADSLARSAAAVGAAALTRLGSTK